MSNRGWCSRLKGARGGGGGDAGNDGEDTGSTCVALMFSMQGVGYLAAHVTGLALLSALPQDSSWAWRLLLGLGAVLPLALVVSLSLAFARARRYRLVQSAVAGLGEDDMEGAMGTNGGGRGGRGRRGREEGEGGGSGASSGPARFWLSVRDKRRLLWKLVGTAGSWFLFDVTFYGNQLVSRSTTVDLGVLGVEISFRSAEHSSSASQKSCTNSRTPTLRHIPRVLNP